MLTTKDQIITPKDTVQEVIPMPIAIKFSGYILFIYGKKKTLIIPPKLA